MIFRLDLSVSYHIHWSRIIFRTLPTKEPVSAPSKKPGWRLKASKDSKAKKKDDSLLKLKKKLSYDRKEEPVPSSPQISEPAPPQALPRVIIRNDLNRTVSQDFYGCESAVKSGNRGAPQPPISASFNPNQNRNLAQQDLLTGSLDHYKEETHRPFIILSQVWGCLFQFIMKLIPTS